MNTMLYNPFREMDRFFDQAARAVARDARLMPMDLYRDGDNFIAKLDLPGVDPATIEVGIDDRTLTVTAERKPVEIESGDKNHWVSRERTTGSFARQLTLGGGLDLANVNADYADGVLTLTIPVAEEAKPRKISVTGTSVPAQVEGSPEEKKEA